MLLSKQWLLAILFCTLQASAAYAAPTPTTTRCPGEKITHTFSSGASWQMCVQLRQAEGIALTQVYYQAIGHESRRVLGEISLSQLETVFDNTTATPQYHVTQTGLGKQLQTMAPTDCPNGHLHALGGSKQVLCRIAQQSGYQYKYTEQRQGEFVDLLSHSYIAPRTYTLRWRFYENGIIEPALGMSGQLPKTAGLTDSFTDHLGWRIDFDLGSQQQDDLVEEVSSQPTADRLRKTVHVTPILEEAGRLLDPENKRFWRIRDGNNHYAGGLVIPSYELITSNYNHSRNNARNQPWLSHDIYFTRYKACERYAAHNLTSNCASNAFRYVETPESLNGADVIIWYKQSYHHLLRSDDNIRVGMVWNTFQLLPRDWHNQNPF